MSGNLTIKKTTSREESKKIEKEKLVFIDLNFLINRKDDFMVTCPSLGELTKLKIGHNNKGPGAGWFLSKIIVDDTLMHRVYEFVCDRWLAEDEGSFKFS